MYLPFRHQESELQLPLYHLFPATHFDRDDHGVSCDNATGTDAGSLTMEQLWRTLDSSPNGLSSAQAQARLEQYGRNELQSPPSKTILEMILEQFEDRLVQILLVVAVLSAVFSVMEVIEATGSSAHGSLWKSFVEPLVIIAILVLNAAVGVWQTKSAQGSLKALQEMQPSLATALRDGEWQSGIDASLLVPGDVLEIRVGDKVPADARLLELQSSSLKTDEGSLTGESTTVGKLPGDEGMVAPNSPVQDQRGMMYSGTMVTSGSGKAVVVQTGMDTQFGKIQQGVTQAKEDQPKTPLAIKLDEFGEQLTVVWIDVGRCSLLRQSCSCTWCSSNSRRTACRHYTLSVSWHSTNGQSQRDCEKTSICGNSWLYIRHLHRQDWYPHDERNDGCIPSLA